MDCKGIITQGVLCSGSLPGRIQLELVFSTVPSKYIVFIKFDA